MARRSFLASLLVLLVACSGAEPASEDSKSEPQVAPALAQRVTWPGVDNVRQLEDRYFTGQPTEEGLRYAAAQGVRTVINLRDDDQADVPFDEAALAKELGLTYRHVPISGKNFTAEDSATFSRLLVEAEGPLVIHCRSGNRVGALWATHLVHEGTIGPGQALEHGKAAGLSKAPTIERTEAVVRELTER